MNQALVKRFSTSKKLSFNIPGCICEKKNKRIDAFFLLLICLKQPGDKKLATHFPCFFLLILKKNKEKYRLRTHQRYLHMRFIKFNNNNKNAELYSTTITIFLKNLLKRKS